MLGTFGTYHFTWVSIAITLAATAAVPLLLMLLFRVVPILSIEEIEEASTGHTPTEPNRSTGREASPVGATGTSHRVAGTIGVLMLVGLMGVLGVGAAGPAQAATPQSGSVSTSLSSATGEPTITVEGVEGGGKVQLTATLTVANGQPQADAPVEFSFTTTQFGKPARLVPLGTVTTDTSGVAKLILGGGADRMYLPTTVGPQEFVATFTPTTADAKPISSSTTVNITVARSAYTPAPPKPLAGVGKGLVVALFAIVAAIWLTMAAQVWRVRRVTHGVQKPTTSSA